MTTSSSPASPVPPAGQWRNHLLAAFLIVLVSANYYGVGAFSDFEYDDYELIVLNPSIRSFDQLPTVLASGRPVRGVTLMIDYALYGLEARGYHLTNYLWHLLGAFLFYFLALRLTGRALTAGVAGVLFALHPVHAEAVMGISHRKEMLAFVFMLFSFHCFLWRERRPYLMVGLSMLFFLLALLSKQVAVVLPGLMLLHHFLFRTGALEVKKAVVPALILAALGAILFGGALLISAPVLRDFNLFGQFRPSELGDISYLKILATSFSALPLSLRFLILPVHNTLDPEFELISFSHPMAWLGVVLFLGLIALAIAFRRRPALSFGLGWVVLNLIPLMNFIPANYYFAERYLYIPSAGVCLLLALAWTRLLDASGPLLSPGEQTLAKAVLIFCIFLILISSPFSNRAIAVWDPELPLRLPSPVGAMASSILGAVVGMAIFLVLERRELRWLKRRPWAEGIATYLIFVLLFTMAAVAAEWMLRGHLGLPALNIDGVWTQIGGFITKHAKPGARSSGSMLIPSFTSGAELANIMIYLIGGPALVFLSVNRLSRRLAGGHAGRELAWRLLALIVIAGVQQLILRNNDWGSQIMLWRQTVIESPRSVNGWNNLAKAYADRGRFDLAMIAYQRLTQLTPNDPRALTSLAETYRGNGEVDRSIETYRHVLELSPRELAATSNLANLLLQKGQATSDPQLVKAAIPYYLRALEINPDHVPSLRGLAFAYLLLGDIDTALNHINRVLVIAPDNQGAAALRQSILDHQSAPIQFPDPEAPPPMDRDGP